MALCADASKINTEPSLYLKAGAIHGCVLCEERQAACLYGGCRPAQRRRQDRRLHVPQSGQSRTTRFSTPRAALPPRWSSRPSRWAFRSSSRARDSRPGASSWRRKPASPSSAARGESGSCASPARIDWCSTQISARSTRKIASHRGKAVSRKRTDGAPWALSFETCSRSTARRWEPLWQGYQEFYRVTLGADVTEATWQRLIDVSEPVHGLGAFDDDRLFGITHFLFHRSTWLTSDTCYLQDLYVVPDSSRARSCAQTHRSRLCRRRREGSGSGLLAHA